MLSSIPLHAWRTVVRSESPVLSQAVRTLAVMLPPFAGLTDEQRGFVLHDMVLEVLEVTEP